MAIGDTVIKKTTKILEASSIGVPAFVEFSKQYVNAKAPKWGGSKPGRRPNKDRNFQEAYNNLIKDYFSGQNSTYDDVDFERRFRVSREIFERVFNNINGKGCFVLKRDCTKKMGIHPLSRIVACLRFLGDGVSFDYLDEYSKIAESTMHDSLKEITSFMVEVFGDEYLNR